MPRPDEGLIHAWLDGQLPPEEASRIEQLAATDAEWADAVAEARGLVAATSRVLSALDHGPAGVIPKSTVPRAPRRLPWWAKAAAAVVIMAGGTMLVMQRASTSALNEEAEKRAATSAVPSATREGAAAKAERAQVASNRLAPVTGDVRNAQPSVRPAIAESKRPAADSDVRMTRSARRADPPSPLPTGDVIASMRGVTAPTPAPISPAVPAELEARRVADRASATKLTLDARQKDARAERRETSALPPSATGKTIAATRTTNPTPSPVDAAAPLALRALEPTPAAARRVSGTAGGVVTSSRTSCYQVRDATSPADASVTMRATRTDGDTLRLEPAQGTSALRAWIVWRGDAGHGAMTPSQDGRGAVAVVAVRAPCPAP